MIAFRHNADARAEIAAQRIRRGADIIGRVAADVPAIGQAPDNAIALDRASAARHFSRRPEHVSETDAGRSQRLLL